MGGVPVAVGGLWERKRLYFRRRGAHSEWASPIMRMTSRESGEILRVASVSGGADKVEREAEAEV
jgi:hypothetical protein